MRPIREMPLKEHFKTADDLAIAIHHLNRVFYRCLEYHPASSRLMKLLGRLLSGAGSANGLWNDLKSLLDRGYHKTASHHEFLEYGHIYYKLDERYKEIAERENREGHADALRSVRSS